MKAACIGSGYVGSVTGAALAALGHPTTIIDIDPKRVAMINAGKSPLYEPGLERLIREFARKRVLSASTSYGAVAEADVVFIAVGTPSLPDGTADLSYVKAASGQIGRHLDPTRFTVVVTKSTVPVGTADLVASLIEQASGLRAREHFAVVSNPEFLREGYALEDVFLPDRIVIGADQPEAFGRMRELYGSLLDRSSYDQLSGLFPFPYLPGSPGAVYFETDPKSAELIKYVSNAFLSVKISYINEVARLCETLGANVLDVAKGMGLDSRIGGKFLEVSSGWSGSCFPKDTSELLSVSQKYGSELTLVKAAVHSNEAMLHYCVQKVQSRLKTLNGKSVGILGLTFKPNTDDARHTQASTIIRKLTDLGASVSAHDPKGMEMFVRLNPELPVTYCSNPEDVATRADAVILLTHWSEYGELNWRQMGETMRHPYVLDTRNFLLRLPFRQWGVVYEGIGI
ncbi:UDP-glucose dehydrogenase family protein [Paenibacillus sp. GCM10012303]|jgi:UDPglucose 6-dehydrogenase|uniref:UDP-glucose dehydrogenase family protein n=1 Tax=Paenibacillus sp. GCM10012303 TaxID=3317340 RepID=UPI003621CBE0